MISAWINITYIYPISNCSDAPGRYLTAPPPQEKAGEGDAAGHKGASELLLQLDKE